MIQKAGLYLSLLFLLTFTACKKDDLAGDSDYKTLGTSAGDLLKSSVYSSLKVEISYMPGHQPDEQSINNLKVFLNTYLNKPAGIQIITREIPASGKSTLTLKDIVALEKKYRRIFTEYNEVGVHILITDTDFSNPDNFATSYWNTSICLFGKTIQESSGAAGQPSRTVLLSTLFQHEFGHLMGLVNQGSPSKVSHIDASNGAHCRNVSCLMFYDVETPIGGFLSAVPGLDADCKADLKANGGK